MYHPNVLLYYSPPTPTHASAPMFFPALRFTCWLQRDHGSSLRVSRRQIDSLQIQGCKPGVHIVHVLNDLRRVHY